MNTLSREQRIKDTISDLVAQFVLYDRKEDDYLPMGEIEQALAVGEITIGEMSKCFQKELKKALGMKRT